MPRRLITPLAVAAFACGLWAAPLAGADAGTINACVNKQTGLARIPKAGGQCTTAERLVSWNNPGPPGPQGPAGAQGPTGPQGPPGASGFQTVSGVTGVVPAGNLGAIDVPCPGGETAIGGGYVVPYTATVLESHPRSDNAGIWTVTAAFPSVSGTITAYAQCAQVTAAAARTAKATGVVVHTTRLPSIPRPASGR